MSHVLSLLRQSPHHLPRLSKYQCLIIRASLFFRIYEKLFDQVQIISCINKTSISFQPCPVIEVLKFFICNIQIIPLFTKLLQYPFLLRHYLKSHMFVKWICCPDGYCIRICTTLNLYSAIRSVLYVDPSFSVGYQITPIFMPASEEIEMIVNLINISYCTMKLLPYKEETFSQYRNVSVQEFQFALSEQIRQQIFYVDLAKNIEPHIKIKCYCWDLETSMLETESLPIKL